MMMKEQWNSLMAWIFSSVETGRNEVEEDPGQGLEAPHISDRQEIKGNIPFMEGWWYDSITAVHLVLFACLPF